MIVTMNLNHITVISHLQHIYIYIYIYICPLCMPTQVMLVWLCFVWSKAYLRGFEDCDVALTVWGYVLYSALLLNFAKSSSCGQRAVGALCVPC